MSRIIILCLFVLALPLLASGATTAGTWVAYPGQETVYQTQVKQPINADGSSVFANNSKSVIPVKFGLLSGLGPFVFESICDSPGCAHETNSADDFSYASFTPSSPLLFKDMVSLVANYTFTEGDCHGGSLRWSVRVSPTQSVFIYYGDWPNFGNGGINGCTTTSPAGSSQSGLNMIDFTDLRYDTSQVGGTFYDTHDGAVALVGNMPIIRASLVLDSGWGGNQQLTLASATVNGNTFTPSPPTALKSTCNLPPADIRVTKVSGDPLGLVNEPVSIQPADTNGQFRIVDCKYMYNLATSSLSGSGRYKVEAVINGNTADGAAFFSLK